MVSGLGYEEHNLMHVPGQVLCVMEICGQIQLK